MPVAVKICGLTRAADIDAAARAGARYAGFVSFPKSPRHVEDADLRDLALAVPPGVAKVALLVDPSDARLDAMAELPLDMIQLHGAETPERVAEVRMRAGLPVIKALGVREAADLEPIEAYATTADMLLVDAKAPIDAERPGGHGMPFDWRLIANRRWSVPWMLAGGLTPENAAQAAALTGAPALDVSSGVEAAPGVKDPARIAAFCAAVVARPAA